MMELLRHGGEHHEIGDGGRLMMTMATDSPLRSPERTPDQPSRECLGPGGGLASLWGPRRSAAPKLSSINSLSSQKKSREKISSRLRYGGAATTCSSSRGQIWSPFWAPERGNHRHRHHQPSSLSNSMKLFIVRE